MSWRYAGRAQTSPQNPRAFGVCDRCGCWDNLDNLRFQFDYRGLKLQNLGIRVCFRCYDKPSPQLRPIILPPDPVPVMNPRPENFAAAENNYRTTQGGDIRVTQDDEDRVTEGGGNQVGEES